MQDWWNKQGIPFSITAGTLIIALAILSKYGLTLDTFQKMFSIFGSLSIVVALATYWNKKNQDRTIAAIDQVSFFRKEVIAGHEDFIELLIKKTGNDKYLSPRIKLDEPSLAIVRRKFPKELHAQEKLFDDRFIQIKQRAILNMLEELTLKISHFKTYDHESLNSIRNPFIDLAETHGAMLLHQREIVTGPPTYETILKIYSKWKDFADRRSPQERIIQEAN